MRFARLSPILCLLFLTGCTRFELLNAMVPAGGYHRTADIAYGSEDRQRLDLYQPRTKPGAVNPPRPIVIFFYGGYWKHGSKDNYRFVGEALTSENYIAILPDYRLYPSVVFPAFVQDGALAVRWAHDHATEIGGDPAHIYLMGHSAGAYISALIAMDPKYLQAVGLDRRDIRGVVGLAGPYDFKIGKELRPAFGLPSITAPTDDNVQPITFVDGHQPPMLLLQGDKDNIVDPGNAARLAARIHQLGGEVTVIMYTGKSHTDLALAFAAPFRWIAPVLKDSVAFFRSK